MVNSVVTDGLLKPRPYLLKNRIQHYEWGTRDEEAFIPRFLGIETERNRPYAELWMGAHSTAPSEVDLNGSFFALDRLISRYPKEILGHQVCKRFSNTFPFLFKVLSAGEALSIQAHPNKSQAEALHKRDPDHYPDNNHKPEIAIALDSLTALVGFKSYPAILKTMKAFPEIADFIGGKILTRLKSHKESSYSPQRKLLKEPSSTLQKELLRDLYSTLIKRSVTDREELERSIDKLYQRLSKSDLKVGEEGQIFLRLRQKYPGADPGLFSIFLFNLVHLNEGQGIFIGAGIPHVYLKGNIVECMTNSDNVVRAGLTPKFTDIEALMDILTYETEPVPILGRRNDFKEIVYQTKVPEFQVTKRKMEAGLEIVEVTDNKPEIVLILKGKIRFRWGSCMECEETFRQGQSILIPAFLEKFALQAASHSEIFKVEVPL
jgi:mannose-6-phosphate isomerase